MRTRSLEVGDASRGVRAVSWTVVALSVLMGSGCAPRFPATGRPTASLRMKGHPMDAVVTIDEEMVGPLSVVAARGVALPEGTHQVTVESPGYFPWDRLVEARPNEIRRIDLDVELLKVPE